MIARFPACRLPPQAEEAPVDFFFSFFYWEGAHLFVRAASSAVEGVVVCAALL